MATCNEVVIRALRTAGVVGLSDVPTADEVDYGMECLQGLFDTWVHAGMFGRLKDVRTEVAYTAKEQERVVAIGGAVVTIPTAYAENGKDGDDRPPYDLSLIEVQSGSTRNVWLYDRNGWVDLLGLELTDQCPLAARGLHGLSCCVAQTMTGPFGAQSDLRRDTRLAAAAFKQALSYKTGSDARPRETEYF